MKKHLFYFLCATAFATVTVAVTGCAVFFNKVADTVLANEVRFDDREAPPAPQNLTASADAVQLMGGQGRGLSCSLPPFAQALAFQKKGDEAPIALQMRQACAFHDYCYRHGSATYGYSQTDCDFLLQQQAFRLCKFIDKSASIGECETDARKVTLGVRLGGFGSFRRARSLDDEKASTFFEFDPYPVRARSYRVVRIADAPRQWVRDGLLPKAAYHFDIRPSGSLVHILGWMPTGVLVCTSFVLPASYDAINGPPMVVRDAAGGDDWFVWWKRAELTATHGGFALLPPGRATRDDWLIAARGWEQHASAAECENRAAWTSTDGASSPAPLAFVKNDVELEFSELHPVNGAETPGFIRLMGLSTHSCNKIDRSLCLVDVEFDTALRQFRKQPVSPTRYRAMEYNCGSELPADGPRDTCDRYRNYVGAPFVVADARAPSLIWTRRGAGNGDGYEAGAVVRRYTIGRTREEPALDLGELQLGGFPESMEPTFIVNATTAKPVFVSVVAGADGFKLLTHAATTKGEEPAVALDCFRHPDNSWLLRPPAMVPDRQDARRSYLVFSRVRIDAATNQRPQPSAALELAVATLANGACTGVHETTFAAFFDDFAAPDEMAAIAAATKESRGAKGDRAREAAGRFAERVRGGQMVLADVTGDGVPDLVQVAKIPHTLRFRTALLIGSIDAAGLTFHALSGPQP